MRGFTRTAKGGLIALGVLVALAVAAVVAAQAPPALPTIVTGTVTIDGTLAPAGKTVTAWIDTTNCGSTSTGSGGSYTVQVGGRPGNPPICDQANATIKFIADGKSAPQTGTRVQGALQTINLTVTTATPTPAPTPAPTPRPAVAPPTGVGMSDGGSFAWWPLALAGAAIIGLAGVAVLRRSAR